MDPFIECVGDPRAMGHAQGLVHRDAIRECIAAAGGSTQRSRIPSLRALISGDTLGRGTGREVIRHYTHLAERMAGIAYKADVPFESLMALFCRETGNAPQAGELMRPALALGSSGAVRDDACDSIVVRTLAGRTLADSPWILRKSRPEVGFVSVEVTTPWFASAVAGINEAGVAVAMAPRTRSHDGGVHADGANPRNAPHAVLLVQECLQRFEDLAGCIEWCLKRPRSGNVSLVVADAASSPVRIEVDGTKCRVVDATQGFVLDGATPEVDQRLRAQLGETQELAPSVLADCAGALGNFAVWLEPMRRKLTLRSLTEDGDAGKAVEIVL